MTASTGNGLNTARSSWASRVVVPVGKYQVSDGDDAHGLLFAIVPSAATIRRSTAMSGSFVSTTAAANGEAWRSARWTSARECGASDTCLVTGFSAATVAVPAGSLASAA